MILLELVGALVFALLVVLGLGFLITKTRFDDSRSAKEDNK